MIFRSGLPQVSAVLAVAVMATAATVHTSRLPATPAASCPAGYEVENTRAWAQRLNPFAEPKVYDDLVQQYGPRLCVSSLAPESLGDYLAVADAQSTPRSAPLAAPPPGALRQAVRQKQALLKAGAQQKIAGAAGTWQEYGSGPLMANDPAFGHTYGYGWSELNGRVDSLDYDPEAKRLFASVGTGGVWTSEDNGDNWRSIGDKLPSQTVGAVAWTPAGGGTVVVGGGEPLVGGGNVYVGLGAYWSNDLGATWNEASGVPEGLMTTQVAVDKSRPEVVYLATSLGLFRSTDAGRSYVNVRLPTSPECAGVTELGPCRFANVVSDVVVKEPGGTTDEAGGQVLAVVGFYRSTRNWLDGKPYVPQAGLYRSDTGEPDSFSYLDVGGDGVSTLGFAPRERVGRVELGNALGPDQNHNYVYALVQDAIVIAGGAPYIDIEEERGSNSLATALVSNINGVYVSADFGGSWTRAADFNEIANNPNSGSTFVPLRALLAPGVQSWYDQWIKPDPSRALMGIPTRVLFGLEEVWANRLTQVPVNGIAQSGPDDFQVVGKYGNAITCFLSVNIPDPPVCEFRDTPVGGTTTHPDQHEALWVPQEDGGVCLFVGHDGGLNRQCVGANGEVAQSGWGDGANRGFNTLLPYHLAAAKDGTVWWGLQDNGSGKTEPTGRRIMTYGGDGFFVAVDPDNSDTAYSETTNGSMRVTIDGGKIWKNLTTGLTSAPFSTPFAMDPLDPKHLIIAGRNIRETLEGPDTCPFATENRACTWRTVFDLGPSINDPAVNRVQTALDLYGSAAYVAFCGRCSLGLRPDLGFNNGIATNIGGDKPPAAGSVDGWHVATAAGLPQRYITGVEIDPANPSTVYLTLGGYYANAQWFPPGSYQDATPNIGTGHVFKSTDAGETFTDISGNLPNVHTTTVTLHEGQLLVGTDIGAFISSDTQGSDWAPLGGGLPNAIVTALQVAPNDPKLLYAATFGRGIYAYRFASAPTVPTDPTTPPVITPALVPSPTPGGVAEGRFGGGAMGAFGLLVLLLASLTGHRGRRGIQGRTAAAGPACGGLFP